MLDVKDLVMSQHGQFKRVGSAVAETFVSVSPTSKKEETPESSEIEADPEKQAKLNQLKSPSEAQQETVVACHLQVSRGLHPKQVMQRSIGPKPCPIVL